MMRFLLAFCILMHANLMAQEKVLTAQPSTTSVKLPSAPQTLNLHISTPQPSVHIENHNTNLNQLYFIQQLRDLAEYGKNTHQYAKAQLVDIAKMINQYASQNYGKIFIGSLALSYGYVWLRLFYLHRATSSSNSWASWKNTQQVDEIETMTSAQLAEKLVLAIQERYQSAEKIADFISPFVAFVNDINKEIKNLKSYIWLLDSLKRLNVIGLFPGYQKSAIHAREKLKRVLYLKNVFSAWIAEYKLQHSTIIHQQSIAGIRATQEKNNEKKQTKENRTSILRNIKEQPKKSKLMIFAA